MEGVQGKFYIVKSDHRGPAVFHAGLGQISRLSQKSLDLQGFQSAETAGQGLSHINLESIDAIRTAVWELEKAGYITRRQGGDRKSKMTAIEYTIYELPQKSPVLENPTLENPVQLK